MMDGWGMTGWVWGWMSVWTAVVVIVLVLIAFAVFRSSTASIPRETEDQAMAVLRRRYAAGEISEDEYNRRRTALEGTTRQEARR